MKKFSISEIEDIIDNQISKHKFEKDKKSWGQVIVKEEKYIKPDELLYVLRKKEKDETRI